MTDYGDTDIIVELQHTIRLLRHDLAGARDGRDFWRGRVQRMALGTLPERQQLEMVIEGLLGGAKRSATSSQSRLEFIQGVGEKRFRVRIEEIT